mgnify:CR=1 FL=1|jgi:hypothetical protein
MCNRLVTPGRLAAKMENAAEERRHSRTDSRISALDKSGRVSVLCVNIHGGKTPMRMTSGAAVIVLLISVAVAYSSIQNVVAASLPGPHQGRDVSASPEHVAELVRQLGSPRFVEREEASEKLSKLGGLAVSGPRSTAARTDPGTAAWMPRTTSQVSALSSRHDPSECQRIAAVHSGLVS